MENNKIGLSIELKLDVETLQKNNITLEQVLDWVKISNAAVVDGFAVSVDAPSVCAFDERFHLPGGFYGLKRSTPVSGETTVSGQVRETVEIVQQGNPFYYVKEEEDVVRLVNSLMKHTTQDPTEKISEPYWSKILENTETILLQACCFFLWKECREEDHNLYSIMKILHSGCDTSEDEDCTPLSEHCVMNYLFREVEEREPDHSAATAFHCFINNAGLKAAQEALLSCIHRLGSMTLSELYSIIIDMKGA